MQPHNSKSTTNFAIVSLAAFALSNAAGAQEDHHAPDSRPALGSQEGPPLLPPTGNSSSETKLDITSEPTGLTGQPNSKFRLGTNIESLQSSRPRALLAKSEEFTRRFERFEPGSRFNFAPSDTAESPGPAAAAPEPEVQNPDRNGTASNWLVTGVVTSLLMSAVALVRSMRNSRH